MGKRLKVKEAELVDLDDDSEREASPQPREALGELAQNAEEPKTAARDVSGLPVENVVRVETARIALSATAIEERFAEYEVFLERLSAEERRLVREYRRALRELGDEREERDE